MLVKFTDVGLFKNYYTSINNVIWVRVTQHKIIIECQDGRHYEKQIKNLLDFEVIHK